jgi:hypothetical protein
MKYLGHRGVGEIYGMIATYPCFLKNDFDEDNREYSHFVLMSS